MGSSEGHSDGIINAGGAVSKIRDSPSLCRNSSVPGRDGPHGEPRVLRASATSQSL